MNLMKQKKCNDTRMDWQSYKSLVLTLNILLSKDEYDVYWAPKLM